MSCAAFARDRFQDCNYWRFGSLSMGPYADYQCRGLNRWDDIVKCQKFSSSHPYNDDRNIQFRDFWRYETGRPFTSSYSPCLAQYQMDMNACLVNAQNEMFPAPYELNPPILVPAVIPLPPQPPLQQQGVWRGYEHEHEHEHWPQRTRTRRRISKKW